LKIFYTNYTKDKKMGWQSYVVGYNTEEEKENILKICRLHNKSDDWENIGEELINFVDIDFKSDKIYKIGPLSKQSKAILFGNGGGRHSTFKFLCMNGLGQTCMGYTSAIGNRFSDSTGIGFEL
jgi:hypothetical protein